MCSTGSKIVRNASFGLRMLHNLCRPHNPDLQLGPLHSRARAAFGLRYASANREYKMIASFWRGAAMRFITALLLSLAHYHADHCQFKGRTR